MDDDELEQALRAGLERRAAEADVTAPVAARARDEVSRRRRTRWGVVRPRPPWSSSSAGSRWRPVAVATMAHGRRSSVTRPSDVAPAGSTEWRTEYWGAVAVDVPADWGYGGAPGAL